MFTANLHALWARCGNLATKLQFSHQHPARASPGHLLTFIYVQFIVHLCQKFVGSGEQQNPEDPLLNNAFALTDSVQRTCENKENKGF